MVAPKPRGPAPKPESQRRRANKPVSYGAATPVTVGVAAPQPKLGFRCHRMVTAMWRSLGHSVEAEFFSAADWERARWELWFANQLFTGVRQLTPPAWNAVQTGLSELMISASDKRRLGIELRAATADADKEAAVSQMASYREQLTG